MYAFKVLKPQHFASELIWCHIKINNNNNNNNNKKETDDSKRKFNYA